MKTDYKKLPKERRQLTAKLQLSVPKPNCRRSLTETVVQRCSVQKVFLEISQNSQENICARVSLF